MEMKTINKWAGRSLKSRRVDVSNSSLLTSLPNVSLLDLSALFHQVAIIGRLSK